MKVKVIRSFTDKYTKESITSGTEIEVTDERFSELTTGPKGVFVETVNEEPTKTQTGDTKSDKQESVDSISETEKKPAKKPAKK